MPKGKKWPSERMSVSCPFFLCMFIYRKFDKFYMPLLEILILVFFMGEGNGTLLKKILLVGIFMSYL